MNGDQWEKLRATLTRIGPLVTYILVSRGCVSHDEGSEINAATPALVELVAILAASVVALFTMKGSRFFKKNREKLAQDVINGKK